MTHKDLRFLAGLIIGGAGTWLVTYLAPGAWAAYHWAVLSGAFLLSAGYACFLFVVDGDLPEPLRLRRFLKLYMCGLLASAIGPWLLDGSNFLLGDLPFVKRLESVLPIVAVFVAIVGSYTSSSNAVAVFHQDKPRE